MGTRLAILAGLVLAGCDESPAPLIAPEQIVGDAIPMSLTGAPGDPERGRMVFSTRDGGHCVLCHVVRSLDEPFQGDLGPDLSGVGGTLSEGQIRLRIVDASRINPETIMPPYYRVDRLNQVPPDTKGKPVLTAAQVEDLVSYLTILREASP